jgi:hypothetical protein
LIAGSRHDPHLPRLRLASGHLPGLVPTLAIGVRWAPGPLAPGRSSPLAKGSASQADQRLLPHHSCSSAATLGLIVYTPILQSWFEKLLSRALSSETATRTVEVLNEALIVTLAATITVMPIIVYHFRRLSLVTLASNLAVLPAQTGNTLCSWVVNRC